MRSYKQALRIIAEDFGLIEKHSDRPSVKIKTSNVTLVEKSETIIQVQPRPFTEGELKWWRNFGITPPTLKRYKVCACESVFLNGNYFSSSSPHIPIYGYYCGKKSHCVWGKLVNDESCEKINKFFGFM